VSLSQVVTDGYDASVFGTEEYLVSLNELYIMFRSRFANSRISASSTCTSTPAHSRSVYSADYITDIHCRMYTECSVKSNSPSSYFAMALISLLRFGRLFLMGVLVCQFGYVLSVASMA